MIIVEKRNKNRYEWRSVLIENNEIELRVMGSALRCVFFASVELIDVSKLIFALTAHVYTQRYIHGFWLLNELTLIWIRRAYWKCAILSFDSFCRYLWGRKKAVRFKSFRIWFSKLTNLQNKQRCGHWKIHIASTISRRTHTLTRRSFENNYSGAISIETHFLVFVSSFLFNFSAKIVHWPRSEVRIFFSLTIITEFCVNCSVAMAEIFFALKFFWCVLRSLCVAVAFITIVVGILFGASHLRILLLLFCVRLSVCI